MKYNITYNHPHQHFIDIEFIVDQIQGDEIEIQLPAWRPGRYELGNFAKNIQKWAAYDGEGNVLKFQKITKDRWKVQTKNTSEIRIQYNYYAAEINAGSSFLDATQLYVNPVNCCVYIPERMHEECVLELHLPSNYQVACGLPVYTSETVGARFIVAKDFHQLVDTPLIASSSLQHTKFECKGIEFHLWFQGECKPDWEKLTNDFTKFCGHQLEMMDIVPFESYHFLFQILPQRFYHGVEHTTSTVIALGTGYNLMKGDLYEELLGVSCHELFHAWNIKTIRPLEMYPYDYAKENYSKLGYVCEGITTYYGDYLLYRCGVFDECQFMKTFAERLQKHFDNFGRFNLSVADSSFDTWLDGYTPGIPNRKTSIYDAGCLLAFLTDIFIRTGSENAYSLDDLMRHLYHEFALKGRGYSAIDYKNVVEFYASSSSYDQLFNNYINGTSDYEPLLQNAMEYIGCELVIHPTNKWNEHALGIKVSDEGGICKVTGIYPDSIADNAGIALHDEILSVNNMQIKTDSSGTNFTEWCNYFGNSPSTIIFATSSVVKEVLLIPEPGNYYKLYKMEKNKSAHKNKKDNFEKWSANKF